MPAPSAPFTLIDNSGQNLFTITTNGLNLPANLANTAISIPANHIVPFGSSANASNPSISSVQQIPGSMGPPPAGQYNAAFTAAYQQAMVAYPPPGAHFGPPPSHHLAAQHHHPAAAHLGQHHHLAAHHQNPQSQSNPQQPYFNIISYMQPQQMPLSQQINVGSNPSSNAAMPTPVSSPNPTQSNSNNAGKSSSQTNEPTTSSSTASSQSDLPMLTIQTAPSQANGNNKGNVANSGNNNMNEQQQNRPIG
jgi:hypothetical protein